MDKKILERKFCVAPMMGYTTPYARNLYRILSKKTFLFTEMIASKTMMHSKNRSLIVSCAKILLWSFGEIVFKDRFVKNVFNGNLRVFFLAF